MRNSIIIVRLFRAGFEGAKSVSFCSGGVNGGWGLRIGNRIVGSKPIPRLHWSMESESDLDEKGLPPEAR